MLDNLLHLIEVGGSVMIPIILLCIWMWTLIIMKTRWILETNRKPLQDKIALACLESGNMIQHSTDLKYCVLCEFMSQLRTNKSLCLAANRLQFEVCIQRQLKELYRFLPTILLLAAVAPLLGLLGTVSGMIETFRVIGMYGLGNSQAMAAGIKEALLTTQAGLLVAIPGLLAGQIMRKKAAGMHSDILIFHRAVNQWLEREYGVCKD